MLLHVPTLTEPEQTGGEDGWTQEPQEDGATDELETRVLFGRTKSLPDGVQGHSQITVGGMQ